MLSSAPKGISVWHPKLFQDDNIQNTRKKKSPWKTPGKGVKGSAVSVQQALLKSVWGRSLLTVFGISRRQNLPREKKSFNYESQLFLFISFYLAFTGWDVRYHLCPYRLVFCHHRTKFPIFYRRQGSFLLCWISFMFLNWRSFPAFSMSGAGSLAHFPHKWNTIAALLACFQFAYKTSTEEPIVWSR